MLNWTVVTNSLVSFTAISFGAWGPVQGERSMNDRNEPRRRWRSVAPALAGLAAAIGGPDSAWEQDRGADWGWSMHPWMWGA